MPGPLKKKKTMPGLLVLVTCLFYLSVLLFILIRFCLSLALISVDIGCIVMYTVQYPLVKNAKHVAVGYT